MPIRNSQLESHSGVAGSYTNLDATINSEGIVTAAANGTPGGGGSNTFTAVAGEAISSNSVVYTELVGGLGTPGYVYNADSTSAGKSTAAFLIGISTTSAASSGDPVTVQWGGLVSGFTGLVDGTPYFIGTTGNLSTVGSTLVGVAISSTQLVLNTRGSQLAIAPSQLFPQSNLILWLDASSGVTSSSGNVSAWADASPLGNDFSTSHGTPILTPSIFGSLPGIFFDGSSGMDSITWSGWASQTDLSVYLVVLWETQPGSSNGHILGNRGTNGGGNTTWCLYTNNVPEIGIWNGTTFSAKSVTASPGITTLLSAIGNGSDIELFQDGGSLGLEGYGLGISSQTHATLGYPHPALTLEFWKGYVGTALVYSQKQNPTDDAATIAYLKSRYPAIP